jgi:hypothetical protein
MLLQFNEDVLFLIFEELIYVDESLHPCLLVNRTRYVTALPILWRNPWQIARTEKAVNALFSVILLHLSEESRNILKNQGMNNLITEIYQRPLFNYISFCRYLNLIFLENVISSKIIKESDVPILRNEILKLFINKNTKFTHLSIAHYFDYQLHLIPGAEVCFSELVSIYCKVNVAQNILEGLARVCKTIKQITLIICNNEIIGEKHGLFKLIEIQKDLYSFHLINFSTIRSKRNENESFFYKSLEKSLIKHADNVEYLSICWNISTRFLSYFVNLFSLVIDMPYFEDLNDKNYLENLSLSYLEILIVQRVPFNISMKLIENTTKLSEISMQYHGVGSDKLIQSICKNCPNLRYFKITSFENSNSLILDLERLLTDCQFLDGLFIDIVRCDDNAFSWDELFIILSRSAPIGLFKFKFHSKAFKLEDLEWFFDNWKNRNPILLKLSYDTYNINLREEQQLANLIEKYKVKGIIKNYSFSSYGLGDFEWI